MLSCGANRDEDCESFPSGSDLNVLGIIQRVGSYSGIWLILAQIQGTFPNVAKETESYEGG